MPFFASLGRFAPCARPHVWRAAGVLMGIALWALVGLRLAEAKRHRQHAHPRHWAGESFVAQENLIVARAGDSLWRLCGQNTGKPWIWPQIWALNPHMTNPHWLAVGQPVAFSLDAGPISSDVDLADASSAAHGLDPTPSTPRSKQKSKWAQLALDSEARPPPILAGLSYVSRNEAAHVARLSNAQPDNLLLRPGDHVFINFDAEQPLKVGTTYAVMRQSRNVEHPKHKRRVGYLVETTGSVVVERVTQDMAEGVLKSAAMEIERGQWVVPLPSPIDPDPAIVVTQRPITAMVLAVERNQLMAGNLRWVFLDQGAVDGLVTGVRLTVDDLADPVASSHRPLPPQQKAHITVVASREHSATCLVDDALWEIWPGDAARTLH